MTRLPSLPLAVLCLALFLSLAPRVLALGPDEIALIANRNVPESAELARHYAQARGIPEGRIIELDLPAGEVLPFEQYEPDVVRPVRAFLESNQLRDKVRCLVTFYGVPLRVAERKLSPQEASELEEVKRELQRVNARVSEAVGRLEKLARELDPRFQPLAVQSGDAAAKRADHAMRAVQQAQQRSLNPMRAGQVQEQVADVGRVLTTPMGDAPTTSPAQPATAPATEPAVGPAATRPTAKDELERLFRQQAEPEARRRLREIGRREANVLAYQKVLQDHFNYLNAQHTDSALDNELALVWADDYNRAGWQPNPLAYPYMNNPGMPRAIMVMRLDAPRPELVKRLIDDSLAAERDGLRGKVVIDSRGIAARAAAGAGGNPDPFGAFDERLRSLARIVDTHTELELVHDDKPDVLPPTDPVEDVALYCGWYSVGKYVPSMKFVPGAVGYHIASYELTSLRDETNTGWGRGMLNDGVAATVGPVSEPLLHAFPMPDDFFPLLLSGRLTLAEVYWRTCPLTSWKMSVIGDPLYAPYRADPPLKVEHVPDRLHPVFSDVER